MAVAGRASGVVWCYTQKMDTVETNEEMDNTTDAILDISQDWAGACTVHTLCCKHRPPVHIQDCKRRRKSCPSSAGRKYLRTKAPLQNAKGWSQKAQNLIRFGIQERASNLF